MALFNHQEQYLEEGMKWDSVEVEFNQNLVNTFHQVHTIEARNLIFMYSVFVY